jgi:hypothetical protein
VTPPSICTPLATLDEQAIRRAALITLRRAILQNFPPGPERDERLEWLTRAVSSRQEAWRALKLGGSAGTPEDGKALGLAEP